MRDPVSPMDVAVRLINGAISVTVFMRHNAVLSARRARRSESSGQNKPANCLCPIVWFT
jgi:hypothetical protein